MSKKKAKKVLEVIKSTRSEGKYSFIIKSQKIIWDSSFICFYFLKPDSVKLDGVEYRIT